MPPLGPQLLDRHNIAEALRHLLAAGHGEETVMHPVARQRSAVMGAAALGELVLVVGEDKVEAAAVNIDCVPYPACFTHCLDHRRALNVPAWPTRSPRRIEA